MFPVLFVVVSFLLLLPLFFLVVVNWAEGKLSSPLASSLSLLLFIGVLFVFSVQCVEQNEYGLVLNWVTKNINNKTVHGGTHLVGFWNTLIPFPAKVTTIEFSGEGVANAEPLHTRTKEGLALHLSISFQYLLEEQNIPKLYALTNTAYEGIFRRVARDEILAAAAEYEGPQYWMARRSIGDQMRKLVNHKLNESFATLWDLQLLTIDLPHRYEQSITKTQVQNQIIRTRYSQQVAAGIRADTEVLQSNFTRDIQVVQAGAEANYTLQTKLAQAEAVRRKLEAEADAIKYTRDRVGLSGPGAVSYTKMSAYGLMDNATFLANLPGIMPTLSVGGSFLQKSQSTEASAPIISHAHDHRRHKRAAVSSHRGSGAEQPDDLS